MNHLNHNGFISEVINSINKGDVGGRTLGYGISTVVTIARNVVSMGKVGSGSFTFWESSTDVGMLYGAKNHCANCSDYVVLFEFNWHTGFYEDVNSGERVHDLLNNAAKRQHYGMFWTAKLNLVDAKVQSL